MSDQTIPNTVGMGNFPVKLRDMGDGSFAPTVFVGGGAMSSGNASLADQSVVDAAGAYWLVRDTGATLSYVNWATGMTGTPVAPVAPAGKLTGEQVRGTQYNVVAAGTGTAIGDVVEHITVLNIATNPASVVSSVWVNLTQGSVLAAAPAAASLVEIAASVAIASMPALPAGTNAIGSVAVSNATLPVTQSGTWSSGRTWTLASGSDSVSATIVGTPAVTISGTPAVSISGNPVLGSGTATIGAISNTGFAASQAGAWTTGRTWALSSANDSVTATIAGTPAVSISGTPAVTISGSPVLGAGSNVIGAISNTGFAASQSGTWTTGRTWALSSANDSVTATIAGTPAVSISGNPVLGAGTNLIGAVNLDIGGAAISAANPVPVIDAYTAPSSVTWTSATATNTVSAFNTNGYDTIIVTLGASGSFAGGVVAFEVFDGANWMVVKSANIANYTTTPGTITPASGSTQGYQVPVAGFPQFRVRLVTTLTAGALTVTTIISSAPDTSVVTVGLDPAQPLPAGTNTIGAISNTGFAITGTLPAFATTPTVINAAYAAQGSSTSGQTGPLIQAAVTASVPSYATAQTSPLSLNTVGALRGDMTSYAGTALTGSVTAYGTAPVGNVFGVNANVTNTIAANVTQLGAASVAAATANGSGAKGLGVTVMTAVAQTDVAGGAFAGSGSVAGATIASTQGGGAVIAAEINVSALALGTATAVFAILQESNGGTNFSDIWISDPITTTGIISMPAIPVAGRRRWRFFSAGGTTTTATATITALELPTGTYPVKRQFRDWYAATNPLASMFNSVVLPASTLVLGNGGSATTPFNIDGCKAVTAFVTVTGSPVITTAPVLTLQLSMDGTNWSNAAATMTVNGNGTFMASMSNFAARFARLCVTTAGAYSSGSFAIANIGVNALG